MPLSLLELAKFVIKKNKEGFQRRIARMSVQRGECRIWIGSVNNKDYPRMNLREPGGKHRTVMVHQLMWVITNRKNIPRDKEVDHICHIRRCIEPSHLQVLTHAENVARTPERKVSMEEIRQMYAELDEMENLPWGRR